MPTTHAVTRPRQSGDAARRPRKSNTIRRPFRTASPIRIAVPEGPAIRCDANSVPAAKPTRTSKVISSGSRVISAHQVDDRKHQDPDEIDHVPERGPGLDRMRVRTA